MFSGQARLRSAALTIAIVAPTFAARAQTSPAGHDTAVRSFHLRAGGGVDVAAAQNTTTANALIGVDWQRRGSRFSVRMGVDYSRRALNNDRRLAQFPELCDGVCVRTFVTQLAGVSLDGRFDLMTTRLRPYVLSGASLNLAMRSDEENRRCAVDAVDAFQCVRTPGEFHVFRGTTPTWGLHAGVGLSLQVGRSQLFSEFRVQTLPISSYANKPMTLGIRF